MQNQLFWSGSFSFWIKGSQFPSSPVGMRSGFVRMPEGSNSLSVEFEKYGGTRKISTNCSFPIRIKTFCELMHPLILEVSCRGHLNFNQKKTERCKRILLSQATVSKMMQLGHLMYEVTRFSTRAMSFPLPLVLELTLAIKPKRYQHHLL